MIVYISLEQLGILLKIQAILQNEPLGFTKDDSESNNLGSFKLKQKKR